MPGLRGRAENLVHAVSGGGRTVRRIVDIPALGFEPGHLTALSGPSGSGKSTLLYLLAGLLAPQGARVRWGEDELSAMSEARRDAWRRRNAGFVFQDFHLIEELPPLDNVLLPIWFSGISASAHRARAAALLDRLAVPRERRGTVLLSRGEQQRVAIARALLAEPRVVFADEPTASLDRASGEQVAAILRALAADEGRTVIVATHDTAVLDRADCVLRIDQGRLAETPAMQRA